MWPKQDDDSLNEFYGDPDPNDTGEADAKWRADSITYITPPYQMFLAWDTSKPVSRIAIHVKCAESLSRILTKIGQTFTPAEIAQYGLNLFGGSFMFRLMRGGSRLSMHSWACAIDMSPAVNSFGAARGSKPNMMPQAAIDIFLAEGWTWLGEASTPDGMHFQAASL